MGGGSYEPACRAQMPCLSFPSVCYQVGSCLPPRARLLTPQLCIWCQVRREDTEEKRCCALPRGSGPPTPSTRRALVLSLSQTARCLCRQNSYTALKARPSSWHSRDLCPPAPQGLLGLTPNQKRGGGDSEVRLRAEGSSGNSRADAAPNRTSTAGARQRLAHSKPGQPATGPSLHKVGASQGPAQ